MHASPLLFTYATRPDSPSFTSAAKLTIPIWATSTVSTLGLHQSAVVLSEDKAQKQYNVQYIVMWDKLLPITYIVQFGEIN